MPPWARCPRRLSPVAEPRVRSSRPCNHWSATAPERHFREGTIVAQQLSTEGTYPGWSGVPTGGLMASGIPGASGGDERMYNETGRDGALGAVTGRQRWPMLP